MPQFLPAYAHDFGGQWALGMDATLTAKIALAFVYRKFHRMTIRSSSAKIKIYQSFCLPAALFTCRLPSRKVSEPVKGSFFSKLKNEFFLQAKKTLCALDRTRFGVCHVAGQLKGLIETISRFSRPTPLYTPNHLALFAQLGSFFLITRAVAS